MRLLGGFALESPQGKGAVYLSQRRAEAVLAMLAVCGDLGCTRERLIALLWPESDEAHSRHGLRDALHAIRHALGPSAVRSAGDLLRLDPAVVEADACTFTQALKSERWEDAVQAYSGPLLDGFHVDGAPEFERWLDGERSRLARRCLETLEQLAERAEAEGRWKEATRWWSRAVELDPLNSHLVLQHVRALAALGDRANAIKVADVHARRLRDELDLEPDREVLAKIERIRRGELLTPADRRAMTAADPVAVTPTAAQGNEEAGTDAPPARSPARGTRRLRWVPLAALLMLAGAFGASRWLRPGAVAHYPRTAIAVLPFQNLSADSAHAFFASGLHDELLTQLAEVAALKVIGRTSVIGYRGSTKPLRDIGEELGAGSIVEGSVQVVGNRLRVIVQLVDAGTEAHIWAAHYDRTLLDAFAVESDIAQRIVAGVGARLTTAKASAIWAAPTQNADAYRYYLQGLEYWRRPGEEPENLEFAQQLYERALTLDSTFALAHAALSLVHGDMYLDSYDPSPARAALQRREAEAALRFAPDLPQAHFAIGAVHYSQHDYRLALGEFRVALRGAPSDAGVWEWIGYAHRRLGDWDSVLVAAEHALQLDPRNGNVIYGVKGSTLGWIRRYRDAITAYRQALALAPDFQRAQLEIGWAYGKWQGQWDSLRAFFRDLPVEAHLDERLAFLAFERQPDSILALLRVRRGRAGQPATNAPSRSLVAAGAHLLRGDSAAARAAFDSARVQLDSLERVRPGDLAVHAGRGLVLARLGRRAEALEEARWLEHSDEYRFDRFVGGEGARSARARILICAGETGAALAEIERLLAGPGITTVYVLARDPTMDPIRHDARFQALLAKYANRDSR